MFHIKTVEKNEQQHKIEHYKKQFGEELNIDEDALSYLVFGGNLKNQAYDLKAEPIRIQTKNKKIMDVLDASDQYNLRALSEPVMKYFVCYPKRIKQKTS